jgi:hypothetical protein
MRQISGIDVVADLLPVSVGHKSEFDEPDPLFLLE